MTPTARNDPAAGTRRHPDSATTPPQRAADSRRHPDTTRGEPLLELIAQTRVVDLGMALVNGMAQSPNHPRFCHCLDRRHGDRVRADGGSAAADLLTMGCHVGTHVDALAHVSHDGMLHGGVDASEAQSGGRFDVLGVHELAPFVGRGVMLDVAAHLGVENCDGGFEVEVDLLRDTAEAQGTPVRPGDAVIVRTGWSRLSDEPEGYVGLRSGVPGVGEAGARWLAAQQPALVGADTIAFEVIAPGAGHALLPAHRVLLVEAGINIVESLQLEELGAAGCHEFVFVLAHLNIVGATGSPARPLALVPAATQPSP